MKKEDLIRLIPLAVLVYIVYMNTLPLGGRLKYTIDMSGHDSMGDARIKAPTTALGPVQWDGGENYRELRNHTLYIALECPLLRIRRDSIITFTVIFKDNFPSKKELIVAAEDEEGWSRHVAYIHLSQEEPTIEGMWLATNIRWSLEELRVRDGVRLQFYISAPHLEEEEYSHYQIPIERITIRVQVPSLHG
jgi:hypothetical protein